MATGTKGQIDEASRPPDTTGIRAELYVPTYMNACQHKPLYAHMNTTNPPNGHKACMCMPLLRAPERAWRLQEDGVYRPPADGPRSLLPT